MGDWHPDSSNNWVLTNQLRQRGRDFTWMEAVQVEISSAIFFYRDKSGFYGSKRCSMMQSFNGHRGHRGPYISESPKSWTTVTTVTMPCSRHFWTGQLCCPFRMFVIQKTLVLEFPIVYFERWLYYVILTSWTTIFLIQNWICELNIVILCFIDKLNNHLLQ